MKATVSLLLLMTTVVEGHYLFRNTVIQGKKTGDWVNVRKTANYMSMDPVTDVTSKSMACYQLSLGDEGAVTYNITAGDMMGYAAYQVIAHPGPISLWMARAPEGQTANTMTGEGSIWFKIHQDYPTMTGNSLSWPSLGKSVVNFTIPQCIPSGDYLLRIEHLGCPPVTKDPSIWLSCAQLTVNGGSGSLPLNLVSIPGAYDPKDPALHSAGTNYKPPGPVPLKCS